MASIVGSYTPLRIFDWIVIMFKSNAKHFLVIIFSWDDQMPIAYDLVSFVSWDSYAKLMVVSPDILIFNVFRTQ
jgi:hypothetical protein